MGRAELLAVYIREAHPSDSHWEDPTLDVMDPKTDAERAGVARRCSAALSFDVPMVVDGVDDAVNMAYSAWPERLYVLKADGTIHYRGDLGPHGFDPQEAADAVAELLGEEAPDLAELREQRAVPEVEEGKPEGEDDGFSGLWVGSGRGRIMEGDIPVRLRLALGVDGTVGGRAEVTSARYPLPLRDGRYDRETGELTARVSIQGRPVKLLGAVREDALTARLVGPGDAELLGFEAKRTRPGAPLVPGPEDATGAWAGAALARDPALRGRDVRIELTAASTAEVAGTVVLGEATAVIERGRYDAKTGALACRARVKDGPVMQVEAVLSADGARGTIRMQPALVVDFTASREEAESR